ncbi:MAG: septal ring lytic transglycosylase RlpA family protein [Hyphomicrobiaceae bacterium]|nr:septal ring lytic transglycosylase RlpA family protein [Hyphomicrobiaceae bacterium]
MITGCSRGKKSSSQKLSKRVVALGQPVPKGGGRYKVGNPYKIGGRWYRPKEQPGYNRVGVASWYGELFHGRYTANGEIYDMNALTAAHPTLPMPSYVQVTNQSNGRTLVLRVNDRGPYAHDRIIDLSRRSARALGFERNGTVRVRVKYLGRAPLDGDDSYERQFYASQRWARYADLGGAAVSKPKKVQVAQATRNKVQADPIVVGSIPDGSETKSGSRTTAVAGNLMRAPRGGHRMFFVQASSFKSRTAADDLNRRLSEIGPSRVLRVGEGREARYRVRLGPYAWRHDADQMLREVVSIGLSDAYMVTQ